MLWDDCPAVGAPCMRQDALAGRQLAAGCDCYSPLATFTACQAACRQSQAGTVPLPDLAVLRIHQAGLSHLQPLGVMMLVRSCCTRHLSVRLLVSRSVCRWA